MLTLEKFEEASEIVKKVTLETKLVYSDYFSAQTGNRVYLKPENLQFTGAYKLRGAYYKMSTLTDEERAKGLITASAGNHAQGVAYAAPGTIAPVVGSVNTPVTIGIRIPKVPQLVPEAKAKKHATRKMIAGSILVSPVDAPCIRPAT